MMMPFLYLVLNNKRWSLIIVLLFVILCQLIQANSLASDLNSAKSDCEAKVQEIEQKHLKALAVKQDQINKVSSDYEAEKSKHRVQVEQVTRTVQKIIDRPVYNNFCFDDDGVSAINSLITNDSSEPP